MLSPILCGLLVMYGAAGCFAPSELTMTSPQRDYINGSFPFSLRYNSGAAISASTKADDTDNRKLSATLMLFDIFPVKEVSVTLAERKYVVPGGQPFGLRIYSDGLLISSVCTVETSNGEACPADDAGICQGDVVVSVNGNRLAANEQLLEAVALSGGKPLTLTLRRDGKAFKTTITPVYDSTVKEYRIGLNIRDSIAGIGTMTFIDPSNRSFAGLGHGICDSGSGSLMPMLEGDIVPAAITSVTKSICGSPGSLCGKFSGNESCGSLALNSDHGVYGTVKSVPQNAETIPVAFKQETVRGDAQIITTVDGTAPEYYNVRIEDVSYNDRGTVKNMIIKITDERLLRKTGGIVQGMSGSPIIQNGMLVGAVTHVFVNDPARGYAVFAENMLPFTEGISNRQSANAA